MTTLTTTVKQKSLFVKCLLGSLALHVLGLCYFYTHPIFIHSSWKSLFRLSSATPDYLSYTEEAAEDANLMIEEAFQKIFVLPHHLHSPLDLVELPQGMACAPTHESQQELSFSPLPLDVPFESQFDSEEFHSAHAMQMADVLAFEPLFVPKHAPIAISSQLNIDRPPSLAPLESLPSPVISQDLLVAIDPDLLSISTHVLEAIPETSQEGVNMLDCVPMLAEQKELLELKTDPRSQLASAMSQQIDKEAHSVSASLFTPPPLTLAQTPAPLARTHSREAARPLPAVDEYDLPALATSFQWNDDFNITLQFYPKEEGEGYTFAATLTPMCDISKYSMKQNIAFILDRSNSVEKHRFAVFKRAIIKALASMQTGDCFNLYVVDKKIVRFSSTPVKYSAKTLRSVEEFLDKQEAGGHFNTADIYSTLEKLLPEVSHPDEVDTAILLTDGMCLQNTAKQQQLLSRWVEENNGKLAVYTAAVGQKNNLVMLDLLSSISGGKLLYSDTHASFPRKLGKLILDLRDPVISEIMVTAIPDNPHAHIEIASASMHMPCLYSTQPYVVVGTIDEPCNFDLIVQGRHNNEWVSIRKNLSFVEADKATRADARHWESMQANACYEDFLKEGKSSYLKEAKKILKSTRSEIAFE
jgi:hypothetical protein